MSKRDERDREIFWRKVKELLDQGMTVSQISKETGKSYSHTKMIADRIRGMDHLSAWRDVIRQL